MSFRRYKVSDLYESSSGLSKSSKEFGFGYPFLTFKDVFKNYFVPDNLESLANTTEKERINCSIKLGDIFITRTSETQDELGMTAVALKDYPEASFNGFTKRLRLKPYINVDVDPIYVGYFFRSPKFRNQIFSFSTMTTRSSLNNSMFDMLEIELPNLYQQNIIGNILSTLDKKIELNNSMNKVLEQMAQAIFKQWFVDFEFPNDKGEPYKSSGGEMEWCVELGKEIPVGWNISNISDIVEVKGGKRLPKGHELKNNMNSHPYIRITDLDNGRINLKNLMYLSEETFSYISRYTINEKDIYISIVGTIGIVGRINSILNGASLTENMAKLIVVDDKKNIINYLLLFLMSDVGKYYISSRTVGSTQPKLALTRIRDIPILVPNNKILDDFEEMTENIYRKIDSNEIQNLHLDGIKDTLIPKLLSGEIDVSEIKL